jgi:hypothetical protein
MFESVTRHALCGEAPLLRELGVDPAEVSGPVRVRLAPKHPSRLDPSLPLLLEVRCDG